MPAHSIPTLPRYATATILTGIAAVLGCSHGSRATGADPTRNRAAVSSADHASRSQDIVIDGVAFQVSARVATRDGRAVLRVAVRVHVVDGRCRGIVNEPLRVRTSYTKAASGMGGRRARSGGLFPVVWLERGAEVVFEDETAMTSGTMNLEEVVIGLFEVESSQPGWSWSADVARIRILPGSVRPGPDMEGSSGRWRPGIEIVSLAQPPERARGWYLAQQADRCPSRRAR